jgi:hypothetical protein
MPWSKSAIWWVWNYGLAAETSEQFFSRTREVANRTPDANGRKGLEDLLASQGRISAEFAGSFQTIPGDRPKLPGRPLPASSSIDR